MLLGSDRARRRLVLFEDPQCPYCRQFEAVSGDLLRSARDEGNVAVEYRMRCFLGIESVRADNALALAAEADLFDELRSAVFASQPPEGTGGFTTLDLLELGRQSGLTGPDYVSGVKEGRYERWVVKMEQSFQEQDSQGTPAGWLDGQPLDPHVLTNPRALASELQS
ncbi:MAG: DsbA family protein [Acidimicrobiales bacterium]